MAHWNCPNCTCKILFVFSIKIAAVVIHSSDVPNSGRMVGVPPPPVQLLLKHCIRDSFHHVITRKVITYFIWHLRCWGWEKSHPNRALQISLLRLMLIIHLSYIAPIIQQEILVDAYRMLLLSHVVSCCFSDLKRRSWPLTDLILGPQSGRCPENRA